MVKVLDFGIAKLASDMFDDEDASSVDVARHTVGTPRYMAPEQYEGLDLTPATDVYSLGMILYEMLTGMAPFTGSSPVEIAIKHANDAPRAPRDDCGGNSRRRGTRRVARA